MPSRTQSRLNWKRSSLVSGSSGSMPDFHQPGDVRIAIRVLEPRVEALVLGLDLRLGHARLDSLLLPAWKRTSCASRITAPITNVATVMKTPMITR